MIESKTAAAAVLALAALTAGGAAQAQTTTRTITVAPVETVITQDANGNTLITRLPLESAPAPMTFTPPPLDTLVTRPVDPASTFVPPPQRTPPPAVAQGEGPRSVLRTAPRQATRHQATPRATRKVAQPALPVATRTAGHARPAAIQRARVARPAGRTVRPPQLASAPVLDAVQRQYIYRTIVEQEMFSSGGALSFAPVTQPGIFARSEVVAPDGVTEYPVAATVRRSPAIGSRLPANVPLVALPEAASEHMRWLARYSYAIVNNRVLLVDPDTSVVVADLTQ
jgi:Protein of unknown function (DUF1236)